MEPHVRLSDPNSIVVRKAACFLGIAKVDLDQLAFDIVSPDGHRKESKKIQSKLLNVFRLEGCHRLEQGHFIDALISRATLSAALRCHGKSIESFRDSCNASDGFVQDVLRLELPGPLQCLSGLHRVSAARRYLNKNDRWWIVRLYEKDHFEADLTNHIQETFGHEQQYTDGTVFRNIRRYHRSGDEENEKKWWARLTPSKRRDLKQLFKDKGCTRAFDGLIDLPGLWPPVQLGTLHRQHGLRCSEEMINYLKHIQDIWYAIVPQELRQYLDEYTVHELELLAPALSKSDRTKVADLFHRGLVFSSVTDHVKREQLLQSVLAQDCLIPSLRTFFENQKYLEPCTMILKSLLDDSDRRSIWQSFRANFFQPDTFQLQVNEGFFGSDDSPFTESQNAESACKLGYLQLWMFCFRHFPEMTAIKPRLEMRTGQQIHSQPIIAALMPKLANLAVALGFRTDKAVSLASEDPDLLAAEQFLRSSIPGLTVDISKHVTDIKRILTGIRTSSQYLSTARCAEFIADQPLLKERRCGRPFEQDHIQDCETLFVPLLYATVDSGTEFSSLYAKIDIFKAFFKHCMPFEDMIMRDLSSTWVREKERRMRAHLGEQQESTDDDMDSRQQTGDSELRPETGLGFSQEAPIQQESSSVQADCSRCSDSETLRADIERLRNTIRMKDIEIQDLQDEIEEVAVDNEAFFGDHRNEDVGIGYNELKHDYDELRSAMAQLELSLGSEIKSLQNSVDAVTSNRDELQRTHAELQNEYVNHQSIAAQRENTLELSLAETERNLLVSQEELRGSQESYVTSLVEQRKRIAELDKEVINLTSQLSATQALNKTDTKVLERHRKLYYPFVISAAEHAEVIFQSDIRYIIEQRSQGETTADQFTVRELLFDEGGLGLRSRLFQMGKTKSQIEEFLAWLCPSERYVFNRCIELPNGHVDFQMIPDADAEALICASGEGIQILYGLKEYFHPTNFPRRYRNGASFGIPPGSKRPRVASGGPNSKLHASVRPRFYSEGAESIPDAVENGNSGEVIEVSSSDAEVRKSDTVQAQSSPTTMITNPSTRVEPTHVNVATYEDLL